MKVLILGSSGFIGRNLKEQLPYQLLTPSERELDILDKNFVMRYRRDNKYDVVINCINCEDNLKAFIHILMLWPNKIIQLGSGAEYDKSRPIINVKENYIYKSMPRDNYGFDKRVISSYPSMFKNIYILRLFGVFGKHEDTKRRFISKAILDNMLRKPITIYQNVKFSYIWVNDLVKIIDYFINNDPKYQSYNVGGHQLTLREIAKKIGKYNILKKGMANEYTCDDSRVRKETGIKYTPFDKSLEELKKYYEQSEV